MNRVVLSIRSFAVLAALLAGPVPARADQSLGRVAVELRAAARPGPLAGYDSTRAREIEARYERNGNAEKRLLERRFGVIEHRFRVDSDPSGILRRLGGAGDIRRRAEGALGEILAGQFSAYYFFDGVIRPNVFAPESYLDREESAIHEKVHLIQPSVYKALGIRCVWKSRRDGCVRSLEPVAVYLTEFALLKRQSPDRSDLSVNRAIERHLALEAFRCGSGTPAPRCPAADRALEYVHQPRDLARHVSRHGLEEGIRRFVTGLAAPPPQDARGGSSGGWARPSESGARTVRTGDRR